jgi:hypothetical protein
MGDPLGALRAAVCALYAVKDGFGLPAEHRASRVAELQRAAVAAALAVSHDADDASARKAEVALLHGRALDAGEAYSPEAERLLLASVTLAPAPPASWAALAHSMWKKGDLGEAKVCYGESLRRGAAAAAAGGGSSAGDADTLRCLSMLLRQSGGSDAAAAVAESVARARQAVALDVRDAASWACLGSAHLAAFFTLGRAALELGNANKAYARAAALEAAALEAAARESSSSSSSAAANAAPPAVPNPDLHFNRGTVLGFGQELDAACAAYALAHASDPALGADARADALRRHARKVADALGRRGCGTVKPKRLQAMSAALHRLAAGTVSGGPAAGLLGGRRVVPLAELAEGANEGAALTVKPLAAVANGDTPPA